MGEGGWGFGVGGDWGDRLSVMDDCVGAGITPRDDRLAHCGRLVDTSTRAVADT